MRCRFAFLLSSLMASAAVTQASAQTDGFAPCPTIAYRADYELIVQTGKHEPLETVESDGKGQITCWNRILNKHPGTTVENYRCNPPQILVRSKQEQDPYYFFFWRNPFLQHLAKPEECADKTPSTLRNLTICWVTANGEQGSAPVYAIKNSSALPTLGALTNKKLFMWAQDSRESAPESLPEKTINNYRCEGFRFKEKGFNIIVHASTWGTTTFWFDTKSGCLVLAQHDDGFDGLLGILQDGTHFSVALTDLALNYRLNSS